MSTHKFNIEQLKKDWQEQNSNTKYSRQQIEKVLSKESKNYVKYILRFSIAEFFVLCIVNIYSFFYPNSENTYYNLLNKIGIKKTPEIEIGTQYIYSGMKILNFIVIIVFIILFYVNLKKISIEDNLKKFIEQTIRFKRSVNSFITINIFLLMLIILSLILFASYHIETQERKDDIIEINTNFILKLFIGSVLITAMSIILIIVYYKNSYGKILAKLKEKLGQLNEIEQENQD